LLNYPETRDNDNALIYQILRELDFLNLRDLTAIEFLERLKEGEYGSLESIRRCRQALQEKDPELRGVLWRKRHNFKDEVKEQLRFEF
jgi:hypothetical protein